MYFTTIKKKTDKILQTPTQNISKIQSSSVKKIKLETNTHNKIPLKKPLCVCGCSCVCMRVCVYCYYCSVCVRARACVLLLLFRNTAEFGGKSFVFLQWAHIHVQFGKLKERKQRGVKRSDPMWDQNHWSCYSPPYRSPSGHTWGTHPATALSHESLRAVKKPDRTEVYEKGLFGKGEQPLNRMSHSYIVDSCYLRWLLCPMESPRHWISQFWTCF